MVFIKITIKAFDTFYAKKPKMPGVSEIIGPAYSAMASHFPLLVHTTRQPKKWKNHVSNNYTENVYFWGGEANSIYVSYDYDNSIEGDTLDLSAFNKADMSVN